MPGIPEFFIDKKINTMLIKTFYPEFISAVMRYNDSLEFIENPFMALGRKKVGQYGDKYWNKTYKTAGSIIKDIFKAFGSKAFYG